MALHAWTTDNGVRLRLQICNCHIVYITITQSTALRGFSLDCRACSGEITGRYQNIPWANRTCDICYRADVQDEQHIAFDCFVTHHLRVKYDTVVSHAGGDMSVVSDENGSCQGSMVCV